MGGVHVADGTRILNEAGLPDSGVPLPVAKPIPIKAAPSEIIGYKKDANGEYYRVYAGPAFSQVLGYASTIYGRAGLERQRDTVPGQPVRGERRRGLLGGHRALDQIEAGRADLANKTLDPLAGGLEAGDAFALTFPLITSLGFDPIWFGVYMTLMQEVAMLTEALGLLEWTAIGAPVCSATAVLSPTWSQCPWVLTISLRVQSRAASSSETQASEGIAVSIAIASRLGGSPRM